MVAKPKHANMAFEFVASTHRRTNYASESSKNAVTLCCTKKNPRDSKRQEIALFGATRHLTSNAINDVFDSVRPWHMSSNAVDVMHDMGSYGKWMGGWRTLAQKSKEKVDH